MARQTEIAKAQVYLDNKQAEAAIDGLKLKSKSLREELSKAIQAGDPEKITKLKREIKGVDAATRSLKKETYDYEKVLKNINGSSYNEVSRALRTVQAQARKLKPLTKEDIALKAQLIKKVQLLKTKQRELNLEQRAYTSGWSKFTTSFNRNFGMVTAGIAALTGIVFSLGQMVKGLTGLDDNLANVMKTTGLTRKEVRGLYTDFKTLNTRTKNSVLLQYAEEAGRLGKTGTKDVLEFVEVANKIGTALGDDLGDAPLAIREVGKLVEIFGVGAQYGTTFGESMEKIGSAINEVAANSSASADYQIDYLKRLSGVAKQAKISAAEIIGYGSVLDQNGQKVEMAATAQSKLMIDMFTNPAQYADIAGEKLEDFTNLLNTDANEAFLKFLEGINGNDEGFMQMATTLDELGVDGARAVQVLTTLASNTDKVRKEQLLANDAMDAGTSLSDEYNIKNNNLAGSWEKIQKRIRAVFMNTKLIETFEGTVSQLATSMENGNFDKFLRFFKNLTIATVAYIAVQKTAYNLDKITHVLRKARVITMALFKGKLSLLTTATRAHTTAQKANNAALSANLYAAIAAAIVILVRKMSQLNKEQIKVNKSHDGFLTNMANEKGVADDLFETYKKLNPESEAAQEIRKKLNDLYPTLMQNYIDEKGYITNIAEAQKIVNDEIIRTIALRSKEDELSELGEKAYNKQKTGVKNILKQTNNSTKKGAAAAILSANKAAFEKGDITEKDLADQLANAMDIRIEDSSRVTKYDNIIGELRRIKSAAGELKDAKKDVEDFYSAFLGVDSNNENSNYGPTRPKVMDDIKVKDTTPELDEDLDLEDMGLTDHLDRKWQERKMKLEKQYAEEGILDQAAKAKILAEEIAYLKTKEALLSKSGEDTLSVRQDIHSKEMDLDAQLWTMEEEEMMSEWDAMLAMDQAEIDALLAKDATKEAEADRHLAAMKLKHEQDKEAAKAANQAEIDEQQRKAEMLMGLSQDLGTLVGQTVADSEATMGSFGKNMVLMALQTMKAMIPIWAAKIVGGSLATPQSIMSGGIVGVAQAAGISALMYAAVGGVEAKVKSSMSKGYYDGGYTDNIDPRKAAGIVHGNEWVGSHKATGNPEVRQFLDVFDIAQRNNTIGSLRVPDIITSVGRGYPTAPAQSSSTTAHSANVKGAAPAADQKMNVGFSLYPGSGNINMGSLAEAILKMASDAKTITGL